MNNLVTANISAFRVWQYQWRGWILGGFFLLLFVTRIISTNKVAPFFLVFVMMGVAYRLWTAKYIGPHTSGVFLDGKVLSQKGPYALGRHPLYFSNLMTTFGLIFFANSLSIYINSIIFLVIFSLHYSVSQTEEQYLLSQHGERYEKYLETTPRWIGIVNLLGMNRKISIATDPLVLIESGKSIQGFDFEISWVRALKNQWGHILKSVLMAILIYVPDLIFGH